MAGSVAGAAAYVLGYVITFVLMREEARRTFEGSVPTWKVVGWYYYNAHYVDLVGRRSFGAFGGSETVNLLAESSASAAPYLYAVPALALVLAGGAVARRRSDNGVVSAAGGGAATVVGYGLVAVIGALLVTHSDAGSFFGVDFSSTVAVPLDSVVVIVGLAYPAVFGTAGAVLWSVLEGGAAAIGLART